MALMRMRLASISGGDAASLLTAQSGHGIDARGASRRERTSDDADDQQQTCGQSKRHGIGWTNGVEQAGQQAGDAPGRATAGDRPKDDQYDSLANDHGPDGAALRSE